MDDEFVGLPLSCRLPSDSVATLFARPIRGQGAANADLRLSSVRPNRGSLRGAYGLSANRLRAGGSEYVFRLNAAQSIRRGSDLILSFRAIG